MSDQNFTTIEELLRRNIRELLAVYGAHHSVTKAQIGRMLFGDTAYFKGILATARPGSSYRVRTYDIIVARFSESWPPSLPWPADIQRIDPANVPDMPEHPGAATARPASEAA